MKTLAITLLLALALQVFLIPSTQASTNDVNVNLAIRSAVGAVFVAGRCTRTVDSSPWWRRRRARNM